MDEPIVIPTYVIGALTLSDGQEIEVKDITEGDVTVAYRRLSGAYRGDCCLYLEVTSPETAADEIKAALEIELVSKTKVDRNQTTEQRQEENYLIVVQNKINKLLSQGKVSEAIKLKGGL